MNLLAEDAHPFLVNVFRQERRAFAMLTTFPKHLEKLIHKGRLAQNKLWVSKDDTINFIDPTP